MLASDLTLATKVVAAAIFARADKHVRAYPSIGSIARSSRLTPRSVQMAVTSLKAAGYVIGGRPDAEMLATVFASYRQDRIPNVLYLTMPESANGMNEDSPRKDVNGVNVPAPRDSNGVKSTTSRGEKHDTTGCKLAYDGVNAHSPKQLLTTREQKKNKPTARAGSTPAKKNPDTIPETLDTPAFCQAWSAWKKHKSEGHKTLTPSTAAQQLKKLSAVSPELAIASIQRSIENGWTAPIYPDNRSHTENGNPANPHSAFDDFKAKVRHDNAKPEDLLETNYAK